MSQKPVEAQVKCQHCQWFVSDAKFCNKCGKPLQAPTKPAILGSIAGNVWHPAPGMFAARIHARELRGLSKELVLEAGTRAVIYGGGKNLGVVEESGPITLVTLLSRINHFGSIPDVSAIVCKDGDLELSFKVGDIRTKESLEVVVTVTVAVRIENFALFVSSLMGKEDVYTITQLERELYYRARQCLRKSVSECGISELGDTHLQTMLDQAIETAMGEFLRPLGIAFRNVRAFDFVHSRYDNMRKMIGEYHLDITVERAKLEHKKNADDFNRERALDRGMAKYQQDQQDLEMAKLADELGLKKREHEQKTGAAQTDLDLSAEKDKTVFAFRRYEEVTRIRKELENRASVDAGQQDVALNAALDDLKRKNLIRDTEWREFERNQAERNETGENATADRRSQRDHVLALLEATRATDLAMARSEAHYRLRLKTLEQDAEVAKMADSEEARQRETRIREAIEDARNRREQELLDFRQSLGLTEEKNEKARSNALADAEVSAQIAATKLETDKQTAAAKLETDKQTAAAKNEDRRERLKILQDMRNGKTDREERKADGQARRDREAAEVKAKNDKQIAEIEKDMTPEQLMARALKDGGPEAAEAVAQILTARAQTQHNEQNAATQAALYQQMIQLLQEQGKQGLNALKELALAQAGKPDTYKELHQQGMQVLGDVAVAQAQGPAASASPAATP